MMMADSLSTTVRVFLGCARAGAWCPGLVGSPQPARCSDPPPLFSSAIASILRAWLDQCAEDFREPPHFPCLQRLLDYLKHTMPGSDPERRAQNLLEQFHKQEADTDSEYLLDPREKPGLILQPPC